MKVWLEWRSSKLRLVTIRESHSGALAGGPHDCVTSDFLVCKHSGASTFLCSTANVGSANCSAINRFLKFRIGATASACSGSLAGRSAESAEFKV